jgi:hypothetical protein
LLYIISLHQASCCDSFNAELEIHPKEKALNFNFFTEHNECISSFFPVQLTDCVSAFQSQNKEIINELLVLG